MTYTPIPTLPDYEAHPSGKIRRKGGDVLSQHVTRGYFSVRIGSQKFYVHRLILETFVPQPANRPQVDHINGDKQDSRLENLRWVTQSENMKALARRPDYEPVRKRVLTPNHVITIRYLRSKGMSAVEIANLFEVGRRHISNICTGWNWRHVRTPWDEFREKPNPNQAVNPQQLKIF